MAEPKRRERVVTTLLHEDEYEELRRVAFEARKSNSAWIRDVMLDEIRRQHRRRQTKREAVA